MQFNGVEGEGMGNCERGWEEEVRYCRAVWAIGGKVREMGMSLETFRNYLLLQKGEAEQDAAWEAVKWFEHYLEKVQGELDYREWAGADTEMNLAEWKAQRG